MHHIERALRKERTLSSREAHKPRPVFLVGIDPQVAYAQQAAKELAMASVTLNALTRPAAKKPKLWRYTRNALLAICMLTGVGASEVWVFNIGWVLGNEAHQETHIKQAPNVTGPVRDFKRERGR